MSNSTTSSVVSIRNPQFKPSVKRTSNVVCLFTLLAMPTALTSVVLTSPVLTSEAQAQDGADSTYLTGPNNYDKLVEAAKSYIGGEGDYSDGNGTMTPTDELRDANAASKRNALTLKMVREALQNPIQPPTEKPDPDASKNAQFKPFWLLAHLLKQDALSKAAAGDWSGAFNADLDVVELGVAIAHGGGAVNGQTGRDMEALGHQGMENLPVRLSGAEDLAVAARIAKIESRRAPFVDEIREDNKVVLNDTREAINGGDWDNILTAAADDAGNTLSESERNQVLNLGEDEILANMTAVFDARVNQNSLPYAAPRPSAVIGRDPWTRLTTRNQIDPNLRIGYETARTQNLLLEYALTLYASKLKSGTYPATLDLPIDPFSNNSPLKYRLDGMTYILYSLGPNAKDDGGIPATTDGGGDILAPVF